MGTTCLVNACLELYGAAVLRERKHRDPYRVEALQNRFRELAAMVPEDSVVGYATDVPITSGDRDFFGAQYALAPRLLIAVDSPEHQHFVVGSFSGETDFRTFETSKRLRLLRDFGGGVALFRPESR